MQPEQNIKVLFAALLLCLGLAKTAQAQECTEQGLASYYAARFEGRPTASGQPYRGSLYTAAHKTLPFGTLLLVKNPETGHSLTVVVTDRGPFVNGRIIDLSLAAAKELDIVRRGVGRVEVYCLPKTLPLLLRKKADRGNLKWQAPTITP
ncbi:septal ring lytic transglycosylase RlpA family protein [Roseivirga sp. BDSF3-8]|uniref:septal ring lytic transglycosylase RlpA family protein n=1 Tax=Roseivirga sp. BDSF3-8 TaxID=3241598 RepID=UPI0035319960